MSELDVIQGFFKQEQKEKIDKYRILNEDVVNFLNEQQSIRTQMLEKLEDDLYYGWGIGNDGVIGDLVSDYRTEYAYTKAYETLDKYNEILANVSSITDLNYALDTIGCPKIE